MVLPLILPALLALAQDPAQPQGPAPYQRTNPRIPQREKEAIERARKGSGQRPVAPARRLPEEERKRAEIFRASKDSVVYIAGIATFQNLFGDIFSQPSGTGTGFVWDEKGHVVTNHHVITVEIGGAPVDEAQELQVTLADGSTYKAQVVGRSLEYDIAVLQVFAPLERMKPLVLGRSGDLVPGQSVLAIGNPFGLDHTLSSGVISAVRREVPTGNGRRIRQAIQTDAAINPGNSGGPLLDSAGNLIGMNTAILNATGASVGIGFAIPVDTLNRVVPQLIQKGQLVRPKLGFDTLNSDAAALLGLRKGVMVFHVEEGSLAAVAGLQGLRFKPGTETRGAVEDVQSLGDVIIGFQGKPIESDIQLMDLMELEPPEVPRVLEVVRDGKRLTITLRPGSVPKAAGPSV
ncbi:MAG: trypsin-like peptidase domain-containing protein [Holophagaceae bacterium]|nr:trypsin-like peptidase domain-containing protein [Holophagaceae bacterium]